MTTRRRDSVTAFAPASVANVGPCYDIMGYALDYVGDFVEITRMPGAGDVKFETPQGHFSKSLSGTTPSQNSAYVVIDKIWARYTQTVKPDFHLHATLFKFMPVESGMGSSAASGAAAAKAILEILEYSYDNTDLWNDLCLGESVTAGTGHPDNVIPSYYGGFHFMPRDIQHHYSDPQIAFYSVVVKPKGVGIKTEQGRKAVRDYILNEYITVSPDEAVSHVLDLARDQSCRAARMIKAVIEKDIPNIGAVLNDNSVLEGARSKLIPNFNEVKRAALEAGAEGCSISGSGPSVVAISRSETTTNEIRDAMIGAFQRPCSWVISPVSPVGARIVDNVTDFINANASHHNFFEP